MGFFNKNEDEALSQLADLLFDFEDDEYFVVNQEFFRKFQGNYTFASLDALQGYLTAIKRQKADEDQLDSTILQCGAYLGEVVRRRSDRNYHWYDFDKLAKKHPIIKDMEWELWLDNVLYSEDTGRYLFPGQVVEQTIGWAQAPSLRAWAQQMARKKSEAEALSKALIIQADDTGIQINGTPVKFPTTVPELEKILGPLSEPLYRLNWNGVWDDYGIVCTYSGDQTVRDLNLQVKINANIPLKPSTPFLGQVQVRGMTLDSSTPQTILLGPGDQQVQVWAAGGGQGFFVGRNVLFQETLPADYYTIKPLSEPVLQFQDFNFKLCIIQELMYNQNLLKPKFDLEQFVNWYPGRKIDLEEEGDDLIPEVVKYFKDLPIPQSLAENITTLDQDGGDEIYLNLIRYGDGEVDCFDIASAEDAKLFPNLKKSRLRLHHRRGLRCPGRHGNPSGGRQRL